jgi:hypothetical protein
VSLYNLPYKIKALAEEFVASHQPDVPMAEGVRHVRGEAECSLQEAKEAMTTALLHHKVKILKTVHKDVKEILHTLVDRGRS